MFAVRQSKFMIPLLAVAFVVVMGAIALAVQLRSDLRARDAATASARASFAEMSAAYDERAQFLASVGHSGSRKLDELEKPSMESQERLDAFDREINRWNSELGMSVVEWARDPKKQKQFKSLEKVERAVDAKRADFVRSAMMANRLSAKWTVRMWSKTSRPIPVFAAERMIAERVVQVEAKP